MSNKITLSGETDICIPCVWWMALSVVSSVCGIKIGFENEFSSWKQDKKEDLPVFNCC